MPRLLYLDHNATTPLLPAVADAIAAAWSFANPSSQHQAGRAARSALERARATIGRFVGADVEKLNPDRVVLTSGGTEANNLALLGLPATRQRRRVLVSSIEHPSVLAAADELARRGFDVQRIRVLPTGAIDLEHFDELLNSDTGLVSVMLANNETGVLQPVSEIADRCSHLGVPLHTDAVQVVGKLPFDFGAIGWTALSLTAHKLHGPVGIGALVLRSRTSLEPLLHGGVQQAGLRPGTEPVALAVGFAAALELAERESTERFARLSDLRNRFERQLENELPDLTIHGAATARLPHVSNVSFLGLNRQALFMALDFAGVACSTGSACASGSSEPSPVLMAMNLAADQVESALRFSLGATTTVADIDEACDRITGVVRRLRMTGRQFR